MVSGLNAIVMLGSLMHAAPGPSEVATLSMGGLMALTRARLTAVVWYPNPESGVAVQLVGRHGTGPGVTDRVSDSLKEFITSIPVMRTSRWSVQELPKVLQNIGIQILLAIPLRFSTENLGFLLVGGGAGEPAPDLALVQALGVQTSTALYIARLRETDAARLTELGRLARELRIQGDLLGRALRLQEGLIDLVLRGRDAERIVAHLADQIGASVWLFDAERNLLAHGSPSTDFGSEPKNSDLMRCLTEAYSDHEPRTVRLHTNAGMRPFLVQSVATDHETYGYLIAGSTALGAVDRTIFQGGRLVLALRLLIERTVAEAEERAGRDLIYDALRGTSALPVEALAARLGYDEDGPVCVLALRLGDQVTEQTNSLRRRITAAVREEIGTGHRAVVGNLGTETIAIVRPDNVQGCVQRLLNRLRAIGAESAVGLSDPHSTLEDLRTAYREAVTTAAMAEHTHSNMLRFADLGLHRLLFDVEHSERTNDHVERWIGALLRYDEGHGGQLVATLRVFLSADSQHAAAESLSIHLSTLKYRVRRIREILDVDLNDADTRFNIDLAFRLSHDLRDGPR